MSSNEELVDVVLSRLNFPLIHPASYVASLITVLPDGLQCNPCNVYYPNTKAWLYHYYHYHRPDYKRRCHLRHNCQFRYSYEHHMIDHAKEEHARILKYCYICDDLFGLTTYIPHALREHFTRRTETDLVSGLIRFANEMIRDWGDTFDIENAITNWVPNLQYTCTKCSESCSTIQILNSHYKKAHIQHKYPCPFCYQCYESYRGVRNHVTQAHCSAQSRFCRQCNIAYFSTITLYMLHNHIYHSS